MSTEFTNYAVFGDASWNLTDAFSVLFGLRYTDDEVSFKHNRRNNDEFGRRGVGVRQATLDTDFDGKTIKQFISFSSSPSRIKEGFVSVSLRLK